MSAALLELAKTRRSVHSVTKASTLTDAELQQLVETAVKETPSAFNSQSGRVVLVLDEEKNAALWALVREEQLRQVAGNDALTAFFSKRIDGFAAGYGTVMFFEDLDVIEANSQAKPGLRDHFPEWSSNSTGMCQYLIWTALAAEGMGASLQHNGAYSKFVPEGFAKLFDLPANWKSTALMPFGVPGAPPMEKTYLPIEDRVKVF
ncbi:nitroreductase family protein [Pseudohyphozyma bogoriensis]|nr:nitroreductase family protein [Pseudohyphozyma bogoriensis]